MTEKLEERRTYFSINDRTYATLSTKLSPNIYRVRVNERTYEVTLLDIYKDEMTVLIDRIPCRAMIADETSDGFVLSLEGEKIRVLLEEKMRLRATPKARPSGQKSADGTIVTKIPGKVISIRVRSGQPIAEGDPLLVLESMKMHVTVKSHRTGVVKEIRVKEGGTVSPGEVMILVE